MIASSMVQLGLSWWQAWVCVWIGYGFVAPFIAMNARPGAVFHVTFPVVARTSFGVYGSLWCTFNRGAMAWCVVPGHSFQVPSFILFFALFESVCGTVCRRASAATVSRCSCVRCGPASMTSVGVYAPTSHDRGLMHCALIQRTICPRPREPTRATLCASSFSG